MNPKIAIGSWAFSFGPFEKQPWSFSKVLQYAADAGYDGVEINGFRPHPHQDDFDTSEKCRILVKEVTSYGLAISGYAPDLHDVPPAIIDSQYYLQVIRKCLAFCASCGIRMLRVDTVSPPEKLAANEYEVRFDRLASTWRQASVVAQNAGVTIAWEFEPGFWLNKPSEVKNMADAVGHPNFKVMFDTSHAYMSGVIGARHVGAKEILPGGIIEYAHMLENHIGHFHLIDSDGTLHGDETSTHAAFGAGSIDFTAFLSEMKPALSKLEWWTVDFCFNAEAEDWGRQAIPFIKERIKEIS